LFEELLNATEVHFDITDNTVGFALEAGIEGGQ
jgi:hypothetical protein